MECTDTKLLAEIPGSNVVKCVKSGLIRWYYRNIMVSFDEVDFKGFVKSLAAIDFEKRGLSTSLGQKFIVINTCHTAIQFVFQESEHRQIMALLDRALVELEIFYLLKS